MRDILIMSIVLVGAVVALRRPWVGVMLWTWLSIMNPHRYTYGFAYSAPVAAIAAGALLLGLLMTRERASPFKGPPVTVFAIFTVWITVSWLLGLDTGGDYPQWNKVMKINLMIFVALALLHTREHIYALCWTAAGSLALVGAKGGIFTLLGGGASRVWGPPGSFIEDNNEFALALVMTIPLLRFLQLQLSSRLGRHLMTAAMLLCATAAIGTYSRGGLLAIAAMTGYLWWRGRKKVWSGIVMAVGAIVLLGFMPDAWFERMGTLQTYEQDASAQGRLDAWKNAWGVALHHPFGVGFDPGRQELFDLYSDGTSARAAHSIYFQILGNHGFVGLALFLLIWLLVWQTARAVQRQARELPQAHWCVQLASMCQVSLLGYFVGGAFLSLSYFDLPYILMVLLVLTRVWVARQAWEREPAPRRGWLRVPGLAARPPGRLEPAPRP